MGSDVINLDVEKEFIFHDDMNFTNSQIDPKTDELFLTDKAEIFWVICNGESIGTFNNKNAGFHEVIPAMQELNFEGVTFTKGDKKYSLMEYERIKINGEQTRIFPYFDDYGDVNWMFKIKRVEKVPLYSSKLYVKQIK